MSVLCVKLEPEATLNHVGAFCMSVSQCPAEWSLSLSDVCDFHLAHLAPCLWTRASVYVSGPRSSCVSFNSIFVILL